MENRENENAIVQLEKNASKEYLVGVGNEEELKDPTPRAEPMESNEIEQVPESDCVFNEGQVEIDQETEPVYLDKDAKKKKSHRVIYMIIAAVLVVCIGAGLVTMYIINKNKSEKLRDEYLDNIREFTSLSYRAEKNLEDISDTTVRYWYENIYEDKHGSSINTAIAYALAAKKSELADAKKYDEDLRALYTEIKRVPDGVPKDDEDELEELCDTAKDVYNTYTAFYSHATDPTGSYNSYSSDNYEKKDEFLTQYLKLLNSTD